MQKQYDRVLLIDLYTTASLAFSVWIWLIQVHLIDVEANYLKERIECYRYHYNILGALTFEKESIVENGDSICYEESRLKYVE